MKGRVHSIDTFGTLDGPGIRTVIFMQGCALRCQYCHNPDTWDCAAASAEEYTVEEIMKIIMRGKPYFEATGGGTTFSGGEPLLQHDFVGELLKKCRQAGIHTAVDTSLYISSCIVREVLPWTSLFLADIKHINEEKSILVTGASNKLNLENLQLISQARIPIWIRYVVVPGLTMAEEDITGMARFVASLDSVERIDLLPYHTLGEHKWQVLGLEYKLSAVTPPDRLSMQKLKEVTERISGKPVFIPD
ncbi:MAG: pyruvate formate-lyase-activating protein [Syntrophomonadaceae bacterium]|jgi:pyruvate formate lyase activating enzyme